MSETEIRQPSQMSSGERMAKFARDVQREAKKSPMPVYIAALAAFLALVSMANGTADKIALQSHIEASNKFAYFQAKNIRATSSQVAAETFMAMNKPEVAANWQRRADRYKQEKLVILSEARDQQKIRAVALKKGEYYGIAVKALQIAIVLASASMIFGGGFLLAGSLLLTGFAAFLTYNGATLHFDMPTDPAVIYEWLKEASGVSFAG